jgi:hypothetical protein
MLFKTKDKLIEYAELSASINFNSVKPTLRVVEQQHIIPVLGQALYTSLDTAFTAAADETTLTQPQKDLLDQCRCVIGPMLCYYYTPKSEIKIGDQGAQRMETATNKTAYQNQILNFREQNLREAEMATELLLQFLEDNKADYTDWQTSDAFKDYRSLFIKSGGEFNKYFSSHSPYRNYWAMRSKMLDVEENNIRTIIGSTLFDALKAKDADPAGTFTDKETALLFKLKKVVAYLTVAFSIPFLNVRIDTNGITVMSPSGRAQDDQLAKRSQASKDDLNIIIEKSEAAAKSWINNVTDYLDANTADFTGWPLVAVVSEDEHIPLTDVDNDNDDLLTDMSGSYGLV